MGNNPISGIDPDGGYSKPGALWRSGFGLRGDIYQSGFSEDGSREVWGFNTSDGEAHFGEDARIGLFGQRDPWYSQAWDCYWGKAHETAVVFNMHDDPNAEGWNSDIARGLVPDNITLEANLGTAVGLLGGNATYTVNLLTRGKEPGFYLTKTFQRSYGLEGAYGLSLGMYHYSGPIKTMTRSTILGRTNTVAGGYGVGGSLTAGFNDEGTIMWSGASLGVGEIIGGPIAPGLHTNGIHSRATVHGKQILLFDE